MSNALERAKNIERILNSPISLGTSFVDTIILIGDDNEADTVEHRFVDTELFPRTQKHRSLQTEAFPLTSGHEFVGTHLAVRTNLKNFLTEAQIRDFFNNSVLKVEENDINIPDIRLASFYQPQTTSERTKYGEATTLLSPILVTSTNKFRLTFVPDKETIVKGINATKGKKWGQNVVEQGSNKPTCYIQFEFLGKIDRPIER